MSIERRNVYRRVDLIPAIAPGTIALVGASPTAGSFGDQTLRNLACYEGKIFLVNGKYDQIGQRKCYPSVSELPTVPDCVLIAVPRTSVEAVLGDCAAKGVKGAIVYASGYAETGDEERIAQQARLAAISCKSGLRIIGPNCIGLINYVCGFGASFSRGIRMSKPRAAAIGLISQSGALGIALTQAAEHGTSFSHMLASGNSADVDIADYIAYLADDPACRVIACVIEGMSSPDRLLEAGELAAAADKPVVVYKLAKGEHGASVAMSHTGHLAGSNAAYRAAFERAGMIVVDRFEDIVETAAFFAKAPRPKAPGVAVVAVSGGQAIMAADQAEAQGIALPQPSERVRALLEASIPDFGAARNPCDVTGQVSVNPESFSACVDAFLSDPAYGALLMPHHNAGQSGLQRIKALDELTRRHDKMGCVVWGSGWLEGPGSTETEQATRLALFRSMDCCFSAIGAWHERELRRGMGGGQSRRLAPEDAAGKARRLLGNAYALTLTERESKSILAAYGVPVVAERLAESVEAAVEAANELGYPVVMKLESPDLSHKTEAGAIQLNLRDEADVRSAFAALMANARKMAPSARINGVLIQPQIPPGVEIMVGARIDPLFGPVIAVGLGGVLVSLLKDTTVALAPVAADEATKMLRSLKGSSLLTGFRGSESVDLERLAEVICRISEFASDQRERFAELDVNPLICSTNQIIAVDALIVRHNS